MRKTLVILVLLLCMGHMQVTALEVSNEDREMYYAKLDGDQWTNVTINQDDYTISSDDEHLDGITGTLLTSIWDMVEKETDKIDFFNLSDMSANPTIVLSIQVGDRENSIALDPRVTLLTQEMTAFIHSMASIHQRVSGHYASGDTWLLDMGIIVMISEPAQYGVSGLLQRNAEAMQSEKKRWVALVVSESNEIAWPMNAKYADNITVSLAAGETSKKFTFDIFGLEENIDYASSYFAILLDDGTYINLANNTVMGYQTNMTEQLVTFLTEQVNQHQSNSGILEFEFLGIIALLPLVFRRKWKRSGYQV